MNVLILDYKCGNIGCIKNIFSYLNNQVTTIPIKNFPEINQDDFDIVVLPGVGNFQHASKYLHENLNFQKFKEWLSLNKKVICICLGFQLLFEESEESDNKSNKYPGIGIIPGKITSLSGTDKLSLNIGWSESKFFNKKNQNNSLKAFLNNHYFYHMHSFGLEYEFIKDEIDFDWFTIAKHRYSKKAYVSSFKFNQYFGFQFHPEKSGNNGLLLLKNIIENAT